MSFNFGNVSIGCDCGKSRLEMSPDPEINDSKGLGEKLELEICIWELSTYRQGIDKIKHKCVV